MSRSARFAAPAVAIDVVLGAFGLEVRARGETRAETKYPVHPTRSPARRSGTAITSSRRGRAREDVKAAARAAARPGAAREVLAHLLGTPAPA